MNRNVRQSFGTRRHAAALLTAMTVAVAAVSASAQVARSIAPDAATGSAGAVVVGAVPLAHTTQLFSTNPRGTILGAGDAARQAAQVLRNLSTALRVAGTDIDRVVKLNVVAANDASVKVCEDTLARYFPTASKPAVSYVVGGLAQADALIAMDAVATTTYSTNSVLRRRSTNLPTRGTEAHVAIMPDGPSVYISGQAEKAPLADATRKTMESLHATLAQLGLSTADVVQIKAFVTPITETAAVRAEMERLYANQPLPPIVFVEWLGSQPIEIEMIAAAPASALKQTNSVTYFTPQGMKASPIYSRVAQLNRGQRTYFSGLYAAEGRGAADQVREIFGTLGKLLAASGSDFKHLVKATYYVSADDVSKALNELRPDYYDPQRPPAASKAVVRGVGRKGRTLTVDMIAGPLE